MEKREGQILNGWRLRVAAVAATSIVCTVVLAACGTTSNGDADGGGGEGVAAGATKEQYIAAFEDIEPIELTAQTLSAPEHYYSKGLQAYVDALTEWSGGKITVDLQFAAAVASPAEADAALADGRLDLADTFPSYAQQKYPVYNSFNQIGYGVGDSLVGMLAWNLYNNDLGQKIPELQAEMKEQGVRMLLPLNISDLTGMGCTTDRSSPAKARGGIARTAGALENPYVEAIGMTTASMPFTEVFEALQRGTVDCTLTSLAQAKVSGYMNIAKFWAVGTDRPAVLHPLAFSEDRWESLPLVAQQLIWDRLDVIYEAQIHFVLEALNGALSDLSAAGGTISDFSDDAVAAFQPVKEKAYADFKASALMADPDSVITQVKDGRTEWTDIVTSAGVDDVSFAEFPDWYAENSDVDLTPLMDQVRMQILDPNRPSA